MNVESAKRFVLACCLTNPQAPPCGNLRGSAIIDTEYCLNCSGNALKADAFLRRLKRQEVAV